MTILTSVALDSRQDVPGNRERMKAYVEQAAAKGAKLIVFPELCLGGLPKNPMFIFNPDDAAYQHEVAELVPEGPSTRFFEELAREHDMYICWGMAEQSHQRADVIYNTLVVVGRRLCREVPQGSSAPYRAHHVLLRLWRLSHHRDALWQAWLDGLLR